MDRRILVVAALALGGCSATLDTSDLDPLGSAETFCQTLFDEFLVHERDCTGWTQQLVDHEYDRALRLCAGFAWSESQGRIRYDQAAAEACLPGVRHAACTVDGARGVEACKAAIPGMRQDGQDCYDDVECADRQARCTYLQPQCPGTCLAPGTAGARCGAGYPRCASGFYCDTTLSPASCKTAWPEGTTCTVGQPACGDGGFCSSSTLKCVRYAHEGEGCSTAKPCGDSDAKLFCDEYNAFGGGPRVCRRLGTIPLGGTCESSEECDLAGYCNGAPGSCVARLGAGSPCLGDSMCARPLACIGDTVAGALGTCAPRVAPGTNCMPGSVDCLIGAACMQADGTGPYSCQPWPSQLGAPCASLAPEKFCYVGWCTTVGVATGPTCQPPVATGQPCTADDQCGGFGGMGAASCQATAVTVDSTNRLCVPGCIAR